jgi:hypothetical protein
MSDYDDSFFTENFEEEELESPIEPEVIPAAPPPAAPKPASTSRPFIMAIVVLGALFALGIMAMAAYAMMIMPQRNAERQEQAAQINAQNTATSQAATQAALVLPVQDTSTSTPGGVASQVESTTTRTPVIILASSTPEADESGGVQNVLAAQDDPGRTQTVAALLTEAAGGDVLGTGTAAVSTAVVAATALPTTGFADEIGLPGLLGISALLIGVILLVRRMRAATHE